MHWIFNWRLLFVFNVILVTWFGLFLATPTAKTYAKTAPPPVTAA